MLAACLLLSMLGLAALPFLLGMGLALGAPLMFLCHARRALKHILEATARGSDFLARALRAGHSFANVLQMAGHELPEPTGGEFRAATRRSTTGADERGAA
jgi:tight adherence protein B